MWYSRHSGILLHPTSLPGEGGIGSFGREAIAFIDFLKAAGQSLWQILPLGPTGYGNSPYSCYSAFAGNPLLINLEKLVEAGDLKKKDTVASFPTDKVDYEAVIAFKSSILKKAAASFFAKAESSRKEAFWNFCDSTFWLHDYALFMVLREYFGEESWNNWPSALVKRDPVTCKEYSDKLGEDIGFQKYMQWQFYTQWSEVKAYANNLGIKIIGDAPIFVAYDSVDVWCNQQIFRLDKDGLPLVVAGVPPDYFSSTGQRWGNPHYNWDNLALDGYNWWLARIGNDLALYDIVRIDHFRGFEAAWTIPASEKTAIKGEWVKGPGDKLFEAVRAKFGNLPIIAEDLGIITPEVEAIRDKFSLPGMKILQFAFEGGAVNAYLPHNHILNSVVYTGTHDNDTTLGWFSGLDTEKQQLICDYLNCKNDGLLESMIRVAVGSVARYAILPMQDVLSLGSSARMNIPGTSAGNWGWRMGKDSIAPALAERLKHLAIIYGRTS
ncbi:MAG: 4-alpha-glucanotransferase [Desulfuromonadales bacterium]|nr:4-alpha-glucanotransferase [Desulfuromonadales bacterium]